ncbi:shikimate dehydrogenase [Microbulbifer discodermiae]|uniref:shikimate dehydrogenase n=1 Tax=Microbulbifer sp. 2201CG32-9 TaxID=3232309 RepID=UPI00345B6EFD
MTDQYAVIGNPIAHSLSPLIHRAFARQTGQDMDYDRLLAPVDAFASIARSFFAAEGLGLNVTVPFKLDAAALADQLTDRARAAGAVNTLVLGSGGRLLGDNTDGAGLVNDLTRQLRWPLEGQRILLLGAGGAARGVLQPLLAQLPEAIHIANRTAARAVQLAQRFPQGGRVTGGGLGDLPGPFNLVINASSASLSGEMPALPAAVISSDTRAYDMVYGAEPTAFMRWAADCGAETADGLGMLVAQAAESFFLWRGLHPQLAPVLSELRAGLKRNQTDEQN